MWEKTNVQRYYCKNMYAARNVGVQKFKIRCKWKSKAHPSLLETIRQGNIRRRKYWENRGGCNIFLPITFLFFSLLSVFWFVLLSYISPFMCIILPTCSPSPFLQVIPRLRKHSGFVCLRSGAEDELSELRFLSDITSKCWGSTLKRPQPLPPYPLLITTHKQSTIQRPIL